MPSLAVHGLLLVLAGGTAWYVSTRTESPVARAGEVEVWQGAPEEIGEVSFSTEKLKVELVPARDETGRYYVGTVTRTVETRTPAPPSRAEGAAGRQGRDDHGHGDHGEAEDGDAHGKTPGQAEVIVETHEETLRFVSVEGAEKLLAQLAPLRASGRVGPLRPEEEAEFGFDAPPGALSVTLAGTARALSLGAPTPGGSDTYARTSTGEVYAISGSILSDLKSADSRLTQRKLHAWEQNAVSAARVTRGAATRDLVVVAGQKPGWAAEGSPEVRDETLGNWMSKVERLQAATHVERPEPPVGPADVVFRIDYRGSAGPLGFVEVARAGTDEQGRAKYLVRSEQTRWWATAPGTAATGVVEDAASIAGE